METFNYQVLALNTYTRKWTQTEAGTVKGAYIEDALDKFDFRGPVEQNLMRYSDGVVERVWNTLDVTDREFERMGVIVTPASVEVKTFS